MTKVHDIEIREEALDIFENAHTLSDEQLTALKNDSELRDDVALIHNVREALRPDVHIDIEEKLSHFHAQHEKIEDKFSVLSHNRIWITALLGAAAMFVGAFFYIHIDDEAKQAEPEIVVFAAEKQCEGITLTVDKGEKLALGTSGSKPKNITLNDFEEVLAKTEIPEKLTLDVPYGSSADFTLPDGSVVYMHPGSQLIFPSRFVGERREVALKGEAYFKVAHDATHSFIVTSGNIETMVLGTEFNICTEKRNVVLVNGSVSLRETTSNTQTILKPGQQASLMSGNKAFAVSNVDVEPYVFWRDGYLYFEQSELKDIVEAIGKNFNMSVVINNKQYLRTRMRFIAKRNEGIEEALKTLNEMGKVHVSVKDNIIYVD